MTRYQLKLISTAVLACVIGACISTLQAAPANAVTENKEAYVQENHSIVYHVSEEEQELALKYWTADKIDSAREYGVGEQQDITTDQIKPEQNKTALEANSQPFTDSTSKAVGKLTFVKNNENRRCSASIVNSNFNRMIITAAHCVENLSNNTIYSHFVFTPNYPYNKSAKYSVRDILIIPEYANIPVSLEDDVSSSRYDVAFITLSTADNLNKKYGSYSLDFSRTTPFPVRIIGYPGNPGNGNYRYAMDSTAHISDSYPYLLYADNQFTDSRGTSGGPWVEKTSITGSKGSIAGIQSHYFSRGGKQLYIYSPIFNSTVQSLYSDALKYY